MAIEIYNRLASLGADVEFLSWLEGEDEWLPRSGNIPSIKHAEFVAAFQAVVWMAQFSGQAPLIHPDTAEIWQSRYDLLEHCLFAALKYSMVGRRINRGRDLATLEKVLQKLLPADLWRDYRSDIRRLRRHRQPPTYPRAEAPRSGGTKEGEQTARMRAAVAHLSTKSPNPYADLASLWNERLNRRQYSGEQIRGRLRKGDSTSGAQALDYWRGIYNGEFRFVFPGPFPLHPKLQERQRVKIEAQCPHYTRLL